MLIDGTRPGSATEARIVGVDGSVARTRFDHVVTEEPLEIRVRAGDATRTVAITMRTPGNDFELAAGFLYAEGILAGPEALRGISYCLDAEIEADQQYNVVSVELTSAELPELAALERHFTTSSACGVCGRAELDALRARGLESIESDAVVDAATITSLLARLRAAQGIFERTGGLHAAALFELDGGLVTAREDVGRHNALDKLVGWGLLQRRLPFTQGMLLVSGRSSYEIVQKALAARVPIVCAVSAPSSLAVDLARAFGLTLIGFLRGQRFNVYSGEERVRLSGP